MNTSEIFNELLFLFALYPQNLNTYEYVINDPMSYIDPFGWQNTTTMPAPPTPQQPEINKCPQKPPCTPIYHPGIYELCVYGGGNGPEAGGFPALPAGIIAGGAIGAAIGSAIGGPAGAGVGGVIGGILGGGGIVYTCYKKATCCGSECGTGLVP